MEDNLFLLASTSTKRVSELHGLSFRVWHFRGWRSCTCSFLLDFVAKTQNTSVPDPHFEEFTVLSLDEFGGGGVNRDKDELLLCPMKALQKYLSRTEQCSPDVEGLFDSTGMQKKRVSQKPSPSDFVPSSYMVVCWLLLRTAEIFR